MDHQDTSKACTAAHTIYESLLIASEYEEQAQLSPRLKTLAGVKHEAAHEAFEELAAFYGYRLIEAETPRIAAE